MQASAGLVAPGAQPGALTRSLPSLIELISVALAIALLWPLFGRVAELGTGRDQRFAETVDAVPAAPASPEAAEATEAAEAKLALNARKNEATRELI